MSVSGSLPSLPAPGAGTGAGTDLASVAGERWTGRPIALVDLLDRLLAGGVVIVGDLSLSIADVELVRISLRALISSVDESLPDWRY